MKNINIYNLSTYVSATQLTTIVKAINQYLVTLASDWNITTYQLVVTAYNSKVQPPANSIFIFNTTDEAGALGYHYEVAGSPYGKVFAKTIIDYGGVVLYKDSSTPTVAQCICHEVMEMIGNPTTNKWFNDNSLNLWAAELCDPVENNVLLTLVGTTKVGLSDYVLPAWFTPDATKGPYNKMNTLRAPFTLDAYGYAIVLQNGQYVAVYGKSINPDTKSKAEQDLAEFKAMYK